MMKKISFNSKQLFCLFILLQCIILMWINAQNGKDFAKHEQPFDRKENNERYVTKFESKHRADGCCSREAVALGSIHVDTRFIPMSKLIEKHSILFNGVVEAGGWWKPRSCQAKETVAIMVPFRKREKQLATFLNHMHPILQRQQLSYRIFLIEQVGQKEFNKGAIYNIGFISSLQYGDFDCYIFHDIDLLPENDLNYYGCPKSPLHMSVAIDKFDYKLPYEQLFGGVEAFRRRHFLTINGFSNVYWGWGAEDDDLYLRVKKNGMEIFRPPSNIARYTMNHQMHYQSSKGNPLRMILLKSSNSRAAVDGLNTVNKLAYTTKMKEKLLYTLVQVDL